MTKSTDDFYTYNDWTRVISTIQCRCMYHYGETPQTNCALDPDITRSNIAALEADKVMSA